MDRYLSAIRTRDRDSEVPYSVVRAGMRNEMGILESVLRGRYRDGDPYFGYNLAVTIMLSDPERAPEAAGILRESWQRGNTDAGYRLAQMLIRGEGIPMSLEEGLRIMGEAALRGHRRALQTMSSVYMDGRLVPKDDAQQLHLYRRCCPWKHWQLQNCHNYSGRQKQAHR